MIAIGSDHGGFVLKEAVREHLLKMGVEVKDFGAYTPDSVDYAAIAAETAHFVADGNAEYGILVCTSGIGVSMAANKVKGIRAALCADTHAAEMTRRHNNANVLCLSGGALSNEAGTAIVDAFLRFQFEGGRHQRRVDQITAIENGEL